MRRSKSHRNSISSKQDGSAFAWAGLKNLCRRFYIDRSGTIALIFGIALIPMLMAVGAAMDYSRALVVRNRLGQALDAAALAVGTSKETNPQKLKQLAQDYFDANYPARKLGVPGVLTVKLTNKTISLSASAKLNTTIMSIAGIKDMNVSAAVEATKEQNALEVVMVLDNTGSMNSNGKLGALKTAAHALINAMAEEQPDQTRLKFALVPFSSSVNVGAQYRNSGWMDTAKQNSQHGWQFENGTNVFAMYDQLTNKAWNGCVETRPAPHDVLDTPPAGGDTLWVPYFAPDEPDADAADAYNYNYDNNYLTDNVNANNTDLDYRQKLEAKYQNQSVSGDGPHYNCKNAPITPLTGTIADIRNSINSMVAGGYTLIPVGLAWGWRVISPAEPFTEGASYSDKSTNKAIILLTDGLNNIGEITNHNKSRYNAYGFVSLSRLGTTNANLAQAELDNKTAELCENIKQQGILLYTITFQLDDKFTEDLFRKCASGPDKYFNSPDNAALQKVFKLIAQDLTKLRLSK